MGCASNQSKSRREPAGYDLPEITEAKWRIPTSLTIPRQNGGHSHDKRCSARVSRMLSSILMPVAGGNKRARPVKPRGLVAAAETAYRSASHAYGAGACL